MKAYEKIESLEAQKEHYAVMLIDRVKEKGSLACEEIGFKSMCDELKTLTFTINTLKEIDEADDEYFFNVDKIFDKIKNTSTGGETMYSIQRRLMTKVENLKNKSNATKIITNGNMASVLQDMANYSINPVRDVPEINSNKTIYPIGQIGDLKIFVDAAQRWDDNRIVFFKDEEEVSTLKVKDTNGVLI